MTSFFDIDTTNWDASFTPPIQQQALQALEQGAILFFPQLNFPLTEAEAPLLSSNVVGHSKNLSFDLASGIMRGGMENSENASLRTMMARYATQTRGLLSTLLPCYRDALLPARTSFRPTEIAGRMTSWRKDDTRLHVDSFPSSPVRGKRILRIFTNVNPHGQPRCWRLGEPFETVATKFLPSLPRPILGSSTLLHLCKITKSRRSAYDHYMLQLHDHMKADLDYQAQAMQIQHDFAPGSTWVVFTDQVSHAAMAGQYLLEQTFYLPVSAMMDESKSPLRTLERLTGKTLVKDCSRHSN